MRSDVWTETYSAYFAAACYAHPRGSLSEELLDVIASNASWVALEAQKRAHMARAEAELYDERLQKAMREAGIK